MVDFRLRFSVNQIQPVFKGDKSVVEFSKAFNIKIQKTHGLTPFIRSEQQGVDAIIESLFFYRAHIRLLKRSDIETDHIA